MRSAALTTDVNFQSGAAPLPGQSRQYSSNDAVNALHIGSQFTDKDARMYPPLKRETSRERSSRVTKQSALRLVPLALDAAVGEKSSPIKRIARAADVDRSTAESWLKGRNLPSAHHLLSLMIAFPEFYAEVRRIIAMEAELHEDLQRDIAALIQKAMQR